MSTFIKLPAILLVSTVLISCQGTSSEKSSINEVLATRIDSLVNSYYLANEFSGSVLVADQGEILINSNYGYANLDLTKKLNSESVYEIASISKQFTALLIMMLKEENILDYDDKITKYLPTIPYDNITIRHLLTHTSGLSERLFFMWAGQNMDPTKIYTNELILKYLEKENPELAFEPGEKWEYSNLGYFLLPLILQQSTAKNYIQLLNDKIFSPLGMNNSGIFSQDFKGNEMDNYVFGKVYNPKDSAFKSSFGMAWSDSIYGGVGIISNTIDLLKWDRALYSDNLVNQKTLQEAFEPFILQNDIDSKYGFGWYIRDDKVINGNHSGLRLDHNGLWPGFKSSIIRYIDKDKTIIILSNQSPSSVDKLIEEISELLFETQYP